MSSVTLMALFPPAFASSASDPLLLAIDLDEVEADPLAASLALAAAFGDAWAFARRAPALGEDMAEAKVEEQPVPFPMDARARQLREMANQVESCFVGDHAMALEWRWAGHPDQDVGVVRWAPIPLVAPGNGLTRMSMG